MKRPIISLCVALFLAGCLSHRPALVIRDDELADRLRATIIPEFCCAQNNPYDIIDFCSDCATDFAPTNIPSGTPAPFVRVVVPDAAREDVPTITFRAENISLFDMLRTISELTGLDLVIEDGNVWMKYRR